MIEYALCERSCKLDNVALGAVPYHRCCGMLDKPVVKYEMSAELGHQ